MAVPLIVAAGAKVALAAAKVIGLKAIAIAGTQVPKLAAAAAVTKVAVAAKLSAGITAGGVKLAAGVSSITLAAAITKGAAVLATPAFTQALVTEVAIKGSKALVNVAMPRALATPVVKIIDAVDTFAGIPLI